MRVMSAARFDRPMLRRPSSLLLLLTLLLWLQVLPAWAGSALQLGAQERIDVWPAATLLTDPTRSLTAAEVLARSERFSRPEGTPSNLGVVTDAVWLRVPLQVPAGGRSEWVLEIDYPPLNHVELYVVRDGRILSEQRMGNALRYADRPLPSRAHAATLTLEPGAQELLLRIETRSSMVLPIALLSPKAFLAQESRSQMLQGVLTGLALCMLVYSLAHWRSLRDPMFLEYAVFVGGTTVFFLAYFGLAQQYLWPNAPELAMCVAPQAVLVATAAGSYFISRVLMTAEISRPIDQALHALGWAAAGATAASLIGLIDYRVTQALATLFGPLCVLLAVPVAFIRARRGERIAIYMLAGWTVYLMGVGFVAGLLRGFVEPGFWTQHLYQFATMVEMTAWMSVLGLRVDEMRRAADRTRLESEALRSLAHTDALTGLPNRRGLNERLAVALQQCSPGHMLAVYLLDLDGFKQVNDRFGHDVGDGLLLAVGARLQTQVRSSDVVARLGGDEFVVLATGLDSDAAAQQLGAKMLAACHESFTVGGQRCDVGMTIGYALAPFDGRDAGDLLRRADAAMYVGKQSGKHCLHRGAASVWLAGA